VHRLGLVLDKTKGAERGYVDSFYKIKAKIKKSLS